LGFSAMGYKVFACARRVEIIEDYNKENIIPVKLDITDPESIKYFKQKILNQKIDILVNCAGGMHVEQKNNTLDYSMEDLNKTFSLNTSGTFEIIKNVVPMMNKDEFPIIITLSSVAGKLYRKIPLPYFIGKSSESELLKYLGLSLHPIRFVDLVISTVNSFEKENMKDNSMSPEDIFNIVKFICASPPYLAIDEMHVRHVNSGGAFA